MADRVAQNLEIISKTFDLVPGRTRILMGFITSMMLLLGPDRNPNRKDSGTLTRF